VGTVEEYQRDLHPADREDVLRALAAAIESRGELHLEYRILRADGEVRWLETRGELMVDAFGRPVRVLGVCADVTARKQIEDALRQAVAAREQVLAVVSHDLRNLLSPIQAGAALMAETVPLEAGARRQIERISRSAEQMERLIQDLLDVSRAEAGHLALQVERLEAGALLEEVVEAHRALAAQRGLRLEARVAPGLPPVAGDRGRVLQVFGNLVGNAVKFTPAGGSVLLTADASGAPAFEQAPAVEALEVLFGVADTGPGIPEADRGRLFEAFWQSPSHAREGRGGTGLGLSITKRLVEGHGGRLWVESDPGRGSVFWFSLPVWAR
jgi:signal transduction histidine kinase